MIRLTIDGKEVATEAGKTILEAAREAGIYIPTLCYHEHLLPIGSCRLCVVEAEGYDKPMAACTTPAVEGISVRTQSELLFRMRQDFLKLILACHPLDCPQCDKGGECRLQELVCEHKIEKAEYDAFREDKKGAYATPLIRYWELRCVVCGRCIHACREISGRAAIDVAGSGFEARIAATDLSDCISCGECLSLCPVGALTETLSPVKSRVWQSERTDTTCPHCGFGCRLTLNVINGNFISKVLSEGEAPPNNASLCVRGRFGYDFTNHAGRLTDACLMVSGEKKMLKREDALQAAAENLARLRDEGKGVGFIASPRVTNEEIFLLSQIAGLFKKARVASSAFYHTGKVAAAFRKMEIGFTGTYDKLLECDLIIVAGADLLANNHLLANKVREAVKSKGARVIVIDPLPASLARIADAHLHVAPGQDALLFNAFSRRLLTDGRYMKDAEGLEGFSELKSALLQSDAALSPTPGGVAVESMEKACELITNTDNIAVIFGSGISGRKESLAALLNFCLLKGLPGQGAIIPTALQANALGAVSIVDDLASPDEVLLDDDISGIFIYEEDPFHFLNQEMVQDALAKKEFVAVCDILPAEVMDFAHLTIPSSTFAEKDGTVISGDGTLRTVKKACDGAPGGPEFLRELLHRLGGKLYTHQAEITGELKDSLITTGNDGKEKLAVRGGRGKFWLKPPSAAPATAATTRPYRLILRDIFMNHHLAGREVYGQGVARLQKDVLYISPEDAAAINLADGDNLCIESDSGAATRPATIKAGIKQGVLECLLFRKRREVLALSLRPAKMIEVAIKKA